MTVVLEYISGQPRGLQLARPIRGKLAKIVKGWGLRNLSLLVHLHLYLRGIVRIYRERDPTES